MYLCSLKPMKNVTDMKHKLFTEDMKLADLIIANPHLLPTLPRFGIKLGFGDRRVGEVCRKNGLAPDFFLLMCNAYTFESYTPYPETIAETDMNYLVPFLIASHRYYLDTQIPHIERHMFNIIGDENSNYANALRTFFSDYKADITEHFDYEERNLFPYIADMQQDRRRNDYSIYDFVQTHSSSIEDKLSDLTLILFKYLPEKKSDNDVIDLIFDLMELTSDLNKHATIEDKILVPYVETLEKGADK